MGTRQCMATSCILTILGTVSGHQAPALTVESLATIGDRSSADTPDSGDDAGGGGLSVIKVPGNEQADLQEERIPDR